VEAALSVLHGVNGATSTPGVFVGTSALTTAKQARNRREAAEFDEKQRELTKWPRNCRVGRAE
jgi:hypothetical protein